MHHMENIWTIVILKICKHTFYAYLSRISQLSFEMYLIRLRYLAPDGQADPTPEKDTFSHSLSLARLLTHTLCVGYKAVCTIKVIIGNLPILLISTQY